MGKGRHRYIVRVSEGALIQMCLNGLEAYIVQHPGAQSDGFVETYGLLWGHETVLPNRKTLYCVEMASVDTSAARGKGFCRASEDALRLKRDVMTSFWPHYSFLGDFHTHPYETYQEVLNRAELECGLAGYEFSPTDRNGIHEESSNWMWHGYRVGLVLAIAGLKKSGSKPTDWRPDCPSVIEFTLANYRLWLKAYVAYEKDGQLSPNDDKVELDCPSLVGNRFGEYTRFGRLVSVASNRHHQHGEIAATEEP